MSLLNKLKKKFGDHAAISPGKEKSASHVAEHIPTGIDVLDHYVLGGGGLPIGRMSEIYGGEGAGKSSLGYQCAASVQAIGGTAVFADPEFSFDEARAEKAFGVDTDELIVINPESLEEMFNMVHTTLGEHDPADGPLLIIWDSIASTIPESAMEDEAGKVRVGEVARLMSGELKKVNRLLNAKRAHMLMLNQIRNKIGVMFGPTTTTPGGNAPKFYASQRLEFFGGKAVKNAQEEHIAKVVTILAQKNRFNTPFLKARVRFDYAHGYNNVWSTLEHAKRMKVIEPREKGFHGKGKYGIKAYVEACKRLGWPANLDTAREPKDDPATESEDDDD